MATNLHIEQTARDAGTDAQTASMALNGGTLEIRDGVQPAKPEDAATGVLLAVLTLNAAAFGASNNGIATAGAITNGVGLVASAPTWARLKTAGGTAKLDGSCGLAAATPDFVINASPIAVGAVVSCSAMTFGTGV